jgi:phosphoribosylaminoimidazole-succinocarboxamide synthase
MSKTKVMYEGKAKILYEGPEPGTFIQHFKDDLTAFNNEKKGNVSGKGVLNNRISEYLFISLEEIGIPTHFIRSLNMREQLIRAVEIIPIEIIVRNVTAGSLVKRFGLEEGMLLPQPVIEYCLKSDKLGDPMISEDHIYAFRWAFEDEVEEIRRLALRINDYLLGLFMSIGIKLVDLKLEFGRLYDEEGNLYILLADEISPDTCRLWDLHSGEKLDKDRFRLGMDGIAEAYQEIATRLGVLTEQNGGQGVKRIFSSGEKNNLRNPIHSFARAKKPEPNTTPKN